MSFMVLLNFQQQGVQSVWFMMWRVVMGSQLEQTHLLASFILPPPALYNHWHAASPISLI